MKILPWILLAAFVGVTCWKWPKPGTDDREALKAAKHAKDSIWNLYSISQDSLRIQQGEVIVLNEKLAMQFKDFDNLKKKYDKIRNSSHNLSSIGAIGNLKTWIRDSIPDR